MIKKAIIFFLNRLGYQIKRFDKKNYFNNNGMFSALKRCDDNQIEVNSVIDIGASDGSWSDICLNIYKDAHYHLIEAQKEHEPKLKSFIGNGFSKSYIIAAAGNQIGEIYFNNSDLYGGLAIENPTSLFNLTKVPVTTVDFEVKKNNLLPPFLIKLDTHGFEVPILEGALETLKQANIVVIEVYNFVIADNSLRFWEMCFYMEKLDFFPIDIVDVMHRKQDNSLWQFDLVFIRKDRKEFMSNSYD